jgi:hypothetical protein
MKILPKGWRVHQGRDPEEELQRLNRRFRAISRRHERAIWLRKFFRFTKVCVLGMGTAVVIYVLLKSSLAWPPFAALKHIAAFPNCNAARAVGLAPAQRGEPGYWTRHDRDGDGWACDFIEVRH